MSTAPSAAAPPAEARPATDYCVVLTTCASDDDARALASALLDQQLAACVQVMPIHSYYTWKGAQQSEPERLLFVKTRRALYDQVEAALRAIHPYETPEIVCLPMAAGSAAYLGWIDQVTLPDKR
jgi:periplasmic divalent cation tolerance protein